MDRLSTICSRLYLKLISDNYQPIKNTKNLIDFLLLDIISNDLHEPVHDLSKNAPDDVKRWLKTKD